MELKTCTKGMEEEAFLSMSSLKHDSRACFRSRADDASDLVRIIWWERVIGEDKCVCWVGDGEEG